MTLYLSFLLDIHHAGKDSFKMGWGRSQHTTAHGKYAHVCVHLQMCADIHTRGELKIQRVFKFTAYYSKTHMAMNLPSACNRLIPLCSPLSAVALKSSFPSVFSGTVPAASKS